MDKHIFDKRLWSIPRDRSKPIYKHIEDLVIRNIRDGMIKPRQLLPSYPWLSKTLGVADKTVRQAYASLQQAGIVVIVSGKGTFVAPPGAPEGASGSMAVATVGVILPVHSGLSVGAYMARLLAGITAAAGDGGLSVLAGDSGQAERMTERQPEAGLILAARPADAVWRKLSVIPRPLVWAGGGEVGERMAEAALDYEGAGRECAYKLVGAGHRRIGLLRPDRDPSGGLLERGVRHALGSAGLAIDPAAVQMVDRDAGETGLTAADALLSLDLSGVVVMGALLLDAFSEAVWRRGRAVPNALSVVATVEEARPTWVGGVPAETVVLDPFEVGRRAVRQLREWGPDSMGRVERVALQWQRGQSLAPVGGLPA